jgi:hypothetical protein
MMADGTPAIILAVSWSTTCCIPPHQSTAAPSMMSDEDKGEAKRAKKAKEKQEKKEKDEAIKVFVNSVSLDDVIWDDGESKSILIGK